MLPKKINFLLNRFNIIENEEVIDNSESGEKIFGVINSKILNKDAADYILIVGGEYLMRRRLFDLVISYDPSGKYLYAQWLLILLSKLLKAKDDELITRFILEDLEGISENLSIFDQLKKKKLFKEFSLRNHSLHRVKDPCDINQYYNSEVLYDAIYPFIERDDAGLIGDLYFYRKLGEAEIPFEDKKYIIYIPLTKRASVILENYNNWCTSMKGRTNFDTYTNNNPSSIGRKSKLYVIIRKSDFEMYQIHFETEQIHNKSNKLDIKGVVACLKDSYGLDRYLYSLIYTLMDKSKKVDLMRKYVSAGIKLGYTNLLIDQYPDTSNKIRVDSQTLRLEFGLERFKNLDTLIFTGCGLTTISDEILSVKTLRILSLPNNKLNSIPEEINLMKKLYILNLNNNNISSFDESIKYLDPSNGGSLVRLSISKNNLNSNQLKELSNLLPNVSVS